MKKIRPILLSTLAIFLGIGLFLSYCQHEVFSVSSGDIFQYNELDQVSPSQVALVLGAKVYADGRLSLMLTDRVDTAFELYAHGKVQRILVSGDHGKTTYDEVNSMKNYLLTKGVKPEDLFLDHAGFDTYDSVYRAKELFLADSVTVVTQCFHVYRAVYIGKSLGMKIQGVCADKREYAGMVWNELREVLARSKAWVDVHTGAKPKFLGEPIPLSGDSHKSWD